MVRGPTVPTLDTQKRLARALAMVGYLAQVKTSTIKELANKFGGDQDSVLQDLNLVACCGIPPYSPLDLVEIIITDEGLVIVEKTELLQQLNKLTGLTYQDVIRLVLALGLLQSASPEELTAASSLKEKILKAAELNEYFVSEVDFLSFEPLINTVSKAMKDNQKLKITYQSLSKDETTSREILPLEILWRGGYCYISACCFQSNSLKYFRLDRIIKLEISSHATQEEISSASSRNHLDKDDHDSYEVILKIKNSFSWILRYVNDYVILEKGVDSITIKAYSWGDAWLTRLILTGGKYVELIQPKDKISSIKEVISELLQRYKNQ